MSSPPPAAYSCSGVLAAGAPRVAGGCAAGGVVGVQKRGGRGVCAGGGRLWACGGRCAALATLYLNHRIEIKIQVSHLLFEMIKIFISLSTI